MSDAIEKKIIFTSQDGNNNPAIMQLLNYSKKERQLQALKALAGMWLIAALTVPIPIVHFATVPGFLIAGIFLAYKKLSADLLEGDVAKGECPSCNNQICIDLEANNELPRWCYCPECKASIELKET